jgi:GxxExxY protein
MYDSSIFKHTELTKVIIGAAMKVHQYFGPGYPEIIYQRAMMIELAKANINASAEVEEPVKYHNEVIGKRRIDIIVENKVLIELKAVAVMDNECHNQVLNCLQVFEYEVGLLINFGKRSLEYKRFARSLKD